MVRLYGLDGDDWPASYFTDSYISQLLEVMGVMDLPRLVIGRQTPALGIWARTRRAQALHHGRIQGGIETVTGVPRTLLDILARDDNALVERDLWQWQGEDNGELLQAHLWDAWRLAGILLVRRQRRQCRLSDASVRDDDDGERCAPSSKHLLWRLVAALEAVRFGLQQVENKHLLVANGTFFPFVIAGTESALLREEPTWLVPLERIREVSPRINPAQNVRTACEILGQAWAELESAVDEVYDLERAIMAWGGELAMF
ncbi:hypothetical protein SEUCBS140593_010510 [Sporothrix eucalyptigena]|uniref:Uncharacterized protein n=1 Tax=Sporothrix eucalyptigena TaxID=1812306 RepID=A0ABP0D1J8_9PEZI